MMFYPTIVDDKAENWIETLSLLAYESNGKEISINDSAHIYNVPKYGTHDPDRDPINLEVGSVSELVAFMFG